MSTTSPHPTPTTATTAAATDQPLFTRAFALLAVGELLYLVADGMAIYLLPVYATGPVGSDRAGAGVAFGSFAFSALLLRPLAGRICDAHGRRSLLVGGALLAAVALLLTAQVDSLAAVVVLRLLAGVGEAAVFVAIFAAVADLAPPNRMGEALSYNSLALYLGLAAGPVLAERVVERWGFAAGWYLASALAAGAALVLATIGETRTARQVTAGRPPLIHRPSLPIALGFLTSIVAMGGFLAFAGLHAEAVGVSSTSLPLFVYGAVVVTGRLAFAKVVDRLPSLPLGAAALALMATGLVVVAVWSSPTGLVAGTAVLALGVTFSTPAFFSAIFAAARPSERGAASATASACLDLGFGGGPILLGYVAEAAGLPWAFGVAAGVAVLGALWTLSRSTSTPPRPAT
jgi:predicted MFS family arabinose efflux permease